MSCVVSKFQRGRCNASYYGENERHLKRRLGDHISISPLLFRKVKPSAESSIRDHLLFCNYEKIKESLLIKLDKPILNKNISYNMIG